MKLSDIVKYLNHLDTLDVHDAMAASIAEVSKITQIVHDSQVQIEDITRDLVSIQQDLKTSLTQYDQKLKQLRQEVQIQIEQQEPEYFAESTNRYQQSMRFDKPEWILQRHRKIDANSEDHLKNRLNSYANWQYPAMVLRPAQSPSLESTVAFDPLYLVDTHQDLLSPVRSLFTPEYQRRLRYYVIDENRHTDMFFNLPHNQIGFVYAFYYFDFKPLEIIQKYGVFKR